MTRTVFEPAQFRNVDLVLEGRARWDRLLEHLGRKVVVIAQGHRGRNAFAVLELSTQRPRTADAMIRAFARALSDLPGAAAREWNATRRRVFDVGVWAGSARAFRVQVGPQTLAAVARLNAEIVVTVYPPQKRARAT